MNLNFTIQPIDLEINDVVFSDFHGWGIVIAYEASILYTPWVCLFAGEGVKLCSRAELDGFANN